MAEWAMDKAHKIIDRYTKLDDIKTEKMGLFQELADYILPGRGQLQDWRKRQERRFSSVVYTSSPIRANELLAATMHGVLVNPAAKWFGFKPRDKQLAQVKGLAEWLEEVANSVIMYKNDSNFDLVMSEYLLDIGCFGNAFMYIDDSGGVPLNFKGLHIGEMVFDEDAFGVVDTVMRKYEMTARQAVQMFGKDKLSEEIVKDAEESPDKLHYFIHAVYPNDNANKNKAGTEYLPYSSCDVEFKAKKTVAKKGYHEMPYIVGRWSRLAGETWGRGPGHTALPDIRMVNKMMETTLRAGEKAVDPPIFVPDEGNISPITGKPGALVFGRQSAAAAIRELPYGHPEYGIDFVSHIEERIELAFYMDRIQMVGADPRMTATEVLERSEQRMLLLGPIMGRQHYETLKTMVMRMYGLLGRARLLPPIPQETVQALVDSGVINPDEQAPDLDVEVDFVSQIAKAQKSGEAAATMRLLQAGVPLIEVYPFIRHKVDPEEVMNVLGDSYGVPAKVLRSKAEMEEMMAEEQEQAEKQAQMQAQMQERAMQTEEVAAGSKAASGAADVIGAMQNGEGGRGGNAGAGPSKAAASEEAA